MRFWTKDGLHHLPKHALTNRENNEHTNSTRIDLVRTSELCSEIDRKSDETAFGATVTASPMNTKEKGSDDEQGKQILFEAYGRCNGQGNFCSE